MFWRYQQEKDDGKDQFGRTYEDAWREHALWCLNTLRENQPDDEEKMNYINRNSPSCLRCPEEFKKYLAGDAVFNAYCELKANFKLFKKYYTKEDIDWVRSCIKDIID